MTESRGMRRDRYQGYAREARAAATRSNSAVRLDYLKLAESWERMVAELDLDPDPPAAQDKPSRS